MNVGAFDIARLHAAIGGGLRLGTRGEEVRTGIFEALLIVKPNHPDLAARSALADHGAIRNFLERDELVANLSAEIQGALGDHLRTVRPGGVPNELEPAEPSRVGRKQQRDRVQPLALKAHQIP